MKSLKLLAVGLLAAASVSLASAQTTIRITGSTAFRKATATAIQNILAPGYTWGGIPTANVGSNQLMFVGNLASNGHAVVIKVSVRGSEGGIFNLTSGTADASTPFIADGTTLSTTGTNLTSGAATDVSPADVSLSDSFQGSSAYKAPLLNDAQVGVIPFVWISAYLNDATVNGLTHQQLKATLLGNGALNLWTGNIADANIPVVVIGRDEDSGTRVVAFQESTFGAGSSPTQFQPTGPAGAFTGLQAWPVNTVNGTTYGVGHSGYPSGGALQAVLNDASLTQYADVISYLGQSDAAAALTNGNAATALPWEGVSYFVSKVGTTVTWNDAAVFNGLYTFWSYEHLFTKSGAAGDVAKTAADIVTRLTTPGVTDANISGYRLEQMKVKRNGDGAPVFNK